MCGRSCVGAGRRREILVTPPWANTRTRIIRPHHMTCMHAMARGKERNRKGGAPKYNATLTDMPTCLPVSAGPAYAREPQLARRPMTSKKCAWD